MLGIVLRMQRFIIELELTHTLQLPILTLQSSVARLKKLGKVRMDVLDIYMLYILKISIILSLLSLIRLCIELED